MLTAHGDSNCSLCVKNAYFFKKKHVHLTSEARTTQQDISTWRPALRPGWNNSAHFGLLIKSMPSSSWGTVWLLGSLWEGCHCYVQTERKVLRRQQVECGQYPAHVCTTQQRERNECGIVRNRGKLIMPQGGTNYAAHLHPDKPCSENCAQSCVAEKQKQSQEAGGQEWTCQHSRHNTQLSRNPST